MQNGNSNAAPEGKDGKDGKDNVFKNFTRAFSTSLDSVKNIFSNENLEVLNPDGSKVASPASNSDEHMPQKKELWGKLSKMVGSDVLSFSLSLPVWLFEPATTLQRQAEMLEYSQLLDKAVAAEDICDRISIMAAFAVSAFSSTERPGKPFNPYLGETFEYIRKDNKARFVAEQVSHHPPVGASHASGEGWLLDEVSSPKTKFLGNSIEIYTVYGAREVTLTGRGEKYQWNTPTAIVHNIILGSMWIEHVGTVVVTCSTSKAKAEITFKTSGWNSAGYHVLEGTVYDAEGNPSILLEGKWHEALAAQRVTKDKTPIGAPYIIWKADAKPNNKYKFTNFMLELNGAAVEYEQQLPLTDSRLRPDRKALDKGDTSLAGNEKMRLEEKQRTERKARDAKGQEWTPKWFKRLSADGHRYEFTGKYWDETRQMDQKAKLESSIFF